MKLEKPTIYFDGACPLCRREIAHYKRCAGADTLQWFDVSKNDPSIMIPGLTKERAMARLHMARPNGELVVGAEAFANLRLQLNRYRWLGRLFRSRTMLRLADLLYSGFLKVRPSLQRLALQWERTPSEPQKP